MEELLPIFVLFFHLLIIHALCDMSLQSDSMAKGKNRNRPHDYVPKGQTPAMIWPYWLTAHALIHAGGVLAVTGSTPAALVQLVTHWFIDFAKCENWTNPHMDQAAHISILFLMAGVLNL